MSQTAAALQKQATRDLGPIWNIDATVDFFPDLESLPFGYWPIIIMDKLTKQDTSGYHTDEFHQPYSIVKHDRDWQLTCSHEMCEMLVDPWGNHKVAGASPRASQGEVQFLVEVCDPCQDAFFSYIINGILMSDFCTPEFFAPQQVPGVRYSYTGAITEPRQILKNGYLTWHDPKTGKWFQQLFPGAKKIIREVSKMESFGSSLRSQVDRLTKNPNAKKAYAEKYKENRNYMEAVRDSGIYASESWGKEISKYRKAEMNKD